MPRFVCEKCGHWANTAMSHWWVSNGKDQRCHRCIVEDVIFTELGKVEWLNSPRYPKASDDAPKGVLINEISK